MTKWNPCMDWIREAMMAHTDALNKTRAELGDLRERIDLAERNAETERRGRGDTHRRMQALRKNIGLDTEYVEENTDLAHFNLNPSSPSSPSEEISNDDSDPIVDPEPLTPIEEGDELKLSDDE